MMKSQLLWIVCAFFLFLNANCKNTSLNDEKKESQSGSLSTDDVSYCYWIAKSTAHKGRCSQGQSSTRVKANIDRSKCEVVASERLDSFTVKLRQGVLKVLGNPSLTQEEETLMQGALIAITEDIDPSSVSIPPIELAKLDELIVKYTAAIEAAIGHTDEAITIEESVKSTGLSLNDGALLVVRRTMNIPFGNVIVSPRYQLRNSFATRALVVQLTGEGCSAVPTGLTGRTIDQQLFYMTPRGAGVFMVPSGQQVNVKEFQVSFNQSNHVWSRCQLEIVQMQETSLYDQSQSFLSPAPSNLRQRMSSSFDSGTDWQQVGTLFFNGGITYNGQFKLPQLTSIYALYFDTRSCPSVRVFAVRTFPQTQCGVSDAGQNRYIVNDCSRTVSSGGIGSLVNSVNFGMQGTWLQQSCPVSLWAIPL